MIPLIKPIFPNASALEAELAESFETRRLSNFGPAYRRLARALDSRGYGRSVLTSSGHSALVCAVGTSDATRWAVPAFTFESTRLAVLEAAREIVYIDVDESGHVSPEALRDADADGVVIVCPLGAIPDFEALRGAIDGRDVVVDAAATFGTPVSNPLCAPWCVSFHATKSLPAGEGGAVACLTAERETAVRRYSNFGLDDERRPSGDGGTNAKMSEYAAAVALALLQGDPAPVDLEIAHRLAVTAIYRSAIGHLMPQSAAETVYSMMPIFMPNADAASRARVVLTEAGVEHRQYYRPLAPLPGAVSCYERNLCLPAHSGVTFRDAQRIADLILESARHSPSTKG